jgi:hypothetical protein
MIFFLLPPSLRNIKNDTFFKNLFKKILIGKEYYEVQEFYENNTKGEDVLNYTYIYEKY